MLHNTLSALLVSVASRYAELSPSDVGIGIDGGRLVIDNVKLRAQTFNSPHIPFTIHEGRAGRLRVNVPWSALSSSPVELYLENVHLIAAPKQSHALPIPPSHTRERDQLAEGHSNGKGEWHQTMVGRLLFNVSVEIYGLKVEYRDDDCVGILSVASLRAFSTGPDWEMRFVSLIEDFSSDATDASSAVAMRKLVKLSGVHCVMIPRISGPEQGDDEAHPHLDRESFESRAPILDGIAITVRVLLCTGKAYTQSDPNRLSMGLHAEIHIDLEEPHLSLTARQMVWIDHILKQGFGAGPVDVKVGGELYGSYANHPGAQTKRRPRPVPPELANYSNWNAGNDRVTNHNFGRRVLDGPQGGSNGTYPPPPPSDSNSAYSQHAKGGSQDLYRDENVDAEIEHISDFDDEEEGDYPSDVITKPLNGGLRSLWRAIVSENGDETVDDAAIALGLRNVYEGEEVDKDDGLDPGEDEADRLFARNAVELAADAGGFTMQLRLKTPDVAAWDLVETLREELRDEREMRARLENLETILMDAEERVLSSEEEARQLKAKNTALVQELEDFEQMTSQAGKNKDAMIRQMEGALAKAEQNLQAMFQVEFDRQQAAHVLSPKVSNGLSNLRSTGRGLDENVVDRAEQQQNVGKQNVQDDISSGRNDEDITAVEDRSREGLEKRVSSSFNGDRHEESPAKEKVGHDNHLAPKIVENAEMELTEEGNVGEENYSPRIMTEVTLRGHVEEKYYSKISSQKLEEAISSEGLTLI